MIVAGEFDGAINFGGAALTSAGSTDVFVARFDAAGNHLTSAAFGDPGFQMARGVAADPAGSFAVVGDFTGSVDFGGGALAAKGQTDGFVALFDAAGAPVASVALGGSDYDSATAVAFSGGSVAVTGYFSAGADFGGKPLTSAGGRDVFLARLSGVDLSTTWARGFGNSAFYQVGQAVALNVTGNLLFAGYFFGALDFGGGPLTSAGDADVFVASFAP